MIGQVILRRATGDRGTGKAELGYLFLPKAWGFGYAANARSLRLAAKLGFTEVERFRAWDAEQWSGMRPPATPSS